MARNLVFGVGMFLLLFVPLVLVAVVGRRSRQPRGNEAGWLLGVPAPSPASAELVARYLHRVRSHRRLGAWIGAVLALGVGLSRQREVTIGIGGGSPLGDLLFGGLAGLLVGSVLADTWRLRPDRQRRAADLTVRTVDPGSRALHPVVVVLTAGTVLLGVSEPTVRSVGLAVAGGVLVLTHRLVLRAVALRGRPLLPDDLRVTDDAIRSFASRRMTLEMLAGAVLLLGWQLTTVRPGTDLELAGAPAALVLTVVLLWRSRPVPPRTVVVHHPPVGVG